MLFLKRMNNKGAAIVEVAFVIAVIIIIGVIAFPKLLNQLGKVRDAADAANLKTARTVAASTYLASGISVDGQFYDIENDCFTEDKPKAYALGTAAGGNVIRVSISDTGDVTASWVE